MFFKFSVGDSILSVILMTVYRSLHCIMEHVISYSFGKQSKGKIKTEVKKLKQVTSMVGLRKSKIHNVIEKFQSLPLIPALGRYV